MAGKEGGERMNKILPIIVVLIVAVGAFAFFGNKKTNQEEIQPPVESEEQVPSQMEEKTDVTSIILSDGFSPKDITVKAGTTVVWVNKTGKPATVSSNDHPTHRLHPFLNLGEFPSNSSLQVAFDEVGTYGYHNHLNASETGTVTVE